MRKKNAMTLDRTLNRYVDHTLLNPQATQDEFEKLLDEAIEFEFESVCVSPYMAVPIRNVLNATGYPHIKVCTVVGFPLGNVPLEVKADETRYFVDRGIDEIDFVLNYGELKNQRFNYVIKELHTKGDNWPFILLGNCSGRIKTGQFTQIEGKRPINALYTTLLHAIGAPCDRFNMDKSMALTHDPKVGPIEELLA